MKLIVGKIYTEVVADFIEMQRLQQLLVAPVNEEGEEATLLTDDCRFATGLLTRVLEILKAYEIDHQVEWTYEPLHCDPREIEFPADILPGIELRPHQLAASIKLVCRGGRGVVDMATGGGKTEIGCAVTKYFGCKTIFVCDRVNAMTQCWGRFRKYGIDAGRLGGGYHEIGHMATIAVVDSLYTGLQNGDPEILNLLNNTEFLLFDEVHHLSAMSWLTVANNCPAPRRAGLSASAFSDPRMKFHDDLMLIGQTGDVVCYVTAKWLIDRGFLAEPLIHFYPVNTDRVKSYNWHEVYDRGIVENAYRNTVVVGVSEHLQRLGYKILILVQRLEHGRKLLKMLNDPNVVFSSGGGSVCRLVGDEIKLTCEDPESIRACFDAQTSGILIGSTIYDECIDIPSMNALVMAGGGKSYRRTIQRIGRPLHSKAEFVHVVDFWDYMHPFLQAHSRKRSEIYSWMEYRQFRGLEELNRSLGIPIDVQRIVHDRVTRSTSRTTA